MRHTYITILMIIHNIFIFYLVETEVIIVFVESTNDFVYFKMAELQDLVTGKDTEAAELRNQIDDLRYELLKVTARNDKLENHLAEAVEKIKTYKQLQSEEKGPEKGKPVVTSVSQKKVSVCSNKQSVKKDKHIKGLVFQLEELQKDLEEQRELANNRLQELDKLHQQHRETLKEVEKLKMDIRQLPESVVVETTEYKCLQSQFSVLYNECMQLKTQLEETRHALHNSKNNHLRQIEIMEVYCCVYRNWKKRIQI